MLYVAERGSCGLKLNLFKENEPNNTLSSEFMGKISS